MSGHRNAGYGDDSPAYGRPVSGDDDSGYPESRYRESARYPDSRPPAAGSHAPGYPASGDHAGYAAPGYPSAPGYPEAGPPASGLFAPGHPTSGHPEPVYPEPVYPEPVYPEPVYPEPVYPEPAYRDDGPPAPSSPGYPEPGYPGSGGAVPGHHLSVPGPAEYGAPATTGRSGRNRSANADQGRPAYDGQIPGPPSGRHGADPAPEGWYPDDRPADPGADRRTSRREPGTGRTRGRSDLGFASRRDPGGGDQATTAGPARNGRQPDPETTAGPVSVRQLMDRQSAGVDRSAAARPVAGRRVSVRQLSDRQAFERQAAEQTFDQPSGEQRVSVRQLADRQAVEQSSGGRRIPVRPAADRQAVEQSSGGRRVSVRELADRDAAEQPSSGQRLSVRQLTDRQAAERRTNGRPTNGRRPEQPASAFFDNPRMPTAGQVPAPRGRMAPGRRDGAAPEDPGATRSTAVRRLGRRGADPDAPERGALGATELTPMPPPLRRSAPAARRDAMPFDTALVDTAVAPMGPSRTGPTRIGRPGLDPAEQEQTRIQRVSAPARRAPDRTEIPRRPVDTGVDALPAEAYGPVSPVRDAVLHTTDLVKVHGQGSRAVVALDGVTMDVERGRFTAIMGASGSGKSTLLHCLAGLDKPTSGQVLLGPTDLTRVPERKLTRLRRDRIGFVFQSYDLLPQLTVRQNIVLPVEVAGAKLDQSWLDTVLDALELGDLLRQLPSQLSGGEQQRVAVARAVLTRPEVVLADEPTGALDAGTAREMVGFLRASVDHLGQTVVMVTHDPLAAQHTDRALMLHEGRLIGEVAAPSAHGVLDALAAMADAPVTVASEPGPAPSRRAARRGGFRWPSLRRRGARRS